METLKVIAKCAVAGGLTVGMAMKFGPDLPASWQLAGKDIRAPLVGIITLAGLGWANHKLLGASKLV